METIVSKDKFIQYAKIVDLLKENSGKENISLSIVDYDIIKEIKDAYKNNPKYAALINKIINAKEGEAVQVVEDYYNEVERQNDMNPEEEISKVFGISVDKINHLYLKNGKELFFFYSDYLERDVVLENNKKGKSIVDILKDIQDSDEKYQSDNPSENANNIMMDERIKSNIELDMYSPNEVLNRVNEIDSLTQDEKRLLNYLLKNAIKLDIKSINVENLFYITNNHEIKEITYNMDFKPVVSSLDREDTTAKEEFFNEDSNSNEEINSMLQDSNEDSNSNEDIDNMLQDSNEDNNEDSNENTNNLDKEKEAVKKLVLVNSSDKGFAGYLGLIAALSTIIALAILMLSIFKMF